MPTLVWKLLRQHISIGQLAGFFLANLFGMMIVLLSVQFYKDVIPVFTEGDSFMKKDFIIATKKISTLGSFAGKSNTFSAEDIADLKKQPFTKTIGAFTPSQFKVSAGLVIQRKIWQQLRKARIMSGQICMKALRKQPKKKVSLNLQQNSEQ